MKFRMLSALLVCCVTGLEAQVALQCSTLTLGQPYSVTLTGASANANAYFALDTQTSPYWVASLGCQIDLALSPKCYLFPKQQCDASGNHMLNLVMANDPAQVGQHAYMQAVTLDPTSYAPRVSNLEHVAVHPAPIVPQAITNLAPGNDQVIPATFSFMSFPFFGGSYTAAHVSSNGRITFSGGLPLAIETAANHLADEPSIAVLWDDLDPSAGGTVGYSEDPAGTWVRISWSGVPQFGGTDSNTATCTLFATGDITMDYSAVALSDCIVGISPGLGLSANTSMDLSTNDWRALSGAIFEQFPAGFDLSGSMLTFHPMGAGFHAVIHN